MSHIILAVGIDNRDLDAIHEADGVDSHLAIIESVINSLYSGTIEDTRSVLQGDGMPADVVLVLAWVPSELRDYVFTSRLYVFQCQHGRLDFLVGLSGRKRAVTKAGCCGGQVRMMAETGPSSAVAACSAGMIEAGPVS
jgi:hypothetical protein